MAGVDGDAVSGNKPVGGLSAACADVVCAFREIFDPYRPERHYMRGPGPKWHAKHGCEAVDLGAPGLASTAH